MKYYRLSGSSEAKIIGVRNGIHQGEIKWKKFKDKSSEEEILNYFIQRLSKSLDSIEEINFEIEYVEAYKSAKITDFFMFTPALYGIYFFVSDKARSILSNYNLPVHTYLPVNIYQNEKLYKYWALYTPQFYNEQFLIFNKCVFNIGDIINKKLITFDNYSEYKKAGYSSAEKLVFRNTIDKKLDLFLSSFIGHAYIVSENLKIAMEEASLTGIVMREPKNPEIFFE